jgi:hypothetical protein
MADPNKEVPQRLLRYHYNPKEFKPNKHAYPFLWKRVTFYNCARVGFWAVVAAMVWKWSADRRHSRIYNFYENYCIAMGLPANCFSGMLLFYLFVVLLAYSVEQQLVDRRIQYVNFWPEEKKEKLLERVKELREEKIAELEQKYQFLNDNPAFVEGLKSRD